MILLTGDTHGDTERFAELLERGIHLGKDDYLVILGDFGFSFRGDKRESKVLNGISKAFQCTVLFVDGNHENFPKIYAHPKKEWKGGMVDVIRPNILHLRRGHVFEIDGKKIFTMGGAYSIDKAYRTEGYSWWPEEIPTQDELKFAMSTLEKHDFNVDYVFTHTCPNSIFYLLPGMMFKVGDPTMTMLEEIYDKLTFKHWFFGHFHLSTKVDEKFTTLYTAFTDLDKYMKGEDTIHAYDICG